MSLVCWVIVSVIASLPGQSQKALSVYLTRKQLLSFGFAEQQCSVALVSDCPHGTAVMEWHLSNENSYQMTDRVVIFRENTISGKSNSNIREMSNNGPDSSISTSSILIRPALSASVWPEDTSAVAEPRFQTAHAVKSPRDGHLISESIAGDSLCKSANDAALSWHFSLHAWCEVTGAGRPSGVACIRRIKVCWTVLDPAQWIRVWLWAADSPLGLHHPAALASGFDVNHRLKSSLENKSIAKVGVGDHLTSDVT